MGVFKNEVGRPSNDVKKKRLIIKIIFGGLLVWAVFGLGYFMADISNKNGDNKKENNINENLVKKYIIKFDSQGGTNVDSQITNENILILKPEDPKKDGFVFIEWQLDGEKFDFSSKITKNCTLIAIWEEKKEEQVVITFDTDGGNTISNLVIEKNSIPTLEKPVRDGYEFIGWFLGDELFDLKTPVVENITLKAKWNKIITTTKTSKTTTTTKSISKETTKTTTTTKKYSVNFNTDGGSNITTQQVAVGGKAIKPNLPSKVGYSFEYWALNGKKYDFDKVVNSDLELTAIWKEIVTPQCSDITGSANSMEYTNEKYTYIISCFSYSDNIDLEIYKKNSSGGKTLIGTTILPGPMKHVSTEVYLNLGETATFYMRTYVKNNGVKEYSKFEEVSITAPKENVNTIKLPKIIVTTDSFEELKGFNMKFSTENNYNYDGIMIFSKYNGNWGGQMIGKVDSYYVDYYKSSDFYYKYINNNLYVKPYIKLSNGEIYYGDETFVPFSK